MEEKKKSNGLVIVLVLLLLGLVGYIIYDKLFTSVDNDTSVVTKTYDYNLTKRTSNQAVRQDNIEILVDNNGEVFLYTIGSSDDANIKALEEKFETYLPKGYSYIDGSTELKAYKLNITNVLTAYYVHLGNGGFSYFVFVKENGKLAYLSYDKIISSGEINVEEISNLENVVTVVENSYSVDPYAVTIDGNEILLRDYIK